MSGGPPDGTRLVGVRAAWRLTRSAPSAAVLVALAALLATIPGLGVPMLMRVFLNQYLVAGNAMWVVPTVVGLLGCAVLGGVLVWLQWQVLALVAIRQSATGSTRLVWHLLRLPVPSIERFGASDLTGRASSLQRQAVQAGVMVPLAIVNVLSLVVYAIALMVLDVRLGGSALLVVVASMAASTVLLRHRRRLQGQAVRSELEGSVATTNIVSSIETVKAASAEQWVFNRWGQVRAVAGGARSDLQADGQRVELITPMTQTVGLGVVLAVGTVMVFDGALDLGTLVAAQGLLVALFVPASQLVWLGVLLEAVASVERLAEESLRVPIDIEMTDHSTDDAGSERPMALSLRFADVVFGYDRNEAPLFEGLDLTIPAGSWVAVVGSSGGGKSTLSRLAVGELQPWSGRIEFNGIPRLDLARAWRSTLIGYVPQYPVLMPGSIADNITMFDESIPIEAVERALRMACIDEAVARRPAGLAENVGPSGHGFSGGELQRLAIARAVVRDPLLLILDEATSALDPIVEVELEANLRSAGLTCLIVAHRLSTVRDADEIVVLDAGRVVQRGAYAEVSTVGRFAELVHG